MYAIKTNTNMRPPALRNFVATSKDDPQKRSTFGETQPRFTPAHMSVYKKEFNVLTQLQSAIQNPHGRMSLPLRETGELRRVHMGTGRPFNSSSVPAKPPRGFGVTELGSDMLHRTGTDIHRHPNFRQGYGPTITNY